MDRELSIDSTNLTNIYYAPIICQALFWWLEYKIPALNEFTLGQRKWEDSKYEQVKMLRHGECWG